MTMRQDVDMLLQQTQGNKPRAKVLRYADLPPFSPSSSSETVSGMVQYFKQLAQDNRQTDKACIILPSLFSLIERLNSTQHQVLNALRELKDHGCDSFIPGMYGPITMWE